MQQRSNSCNSLDLPTYDMLYLFLRCIARGHQYTDATCIALPSIAHSTWAIVEQSVAGIMDAPVMVVMRRLFSSSLYVRALLGLELARP